MPLQGKSPLQGQGTSRGQGGGLSLSPSPAVSNLEVKQTRHMGDPEG